LTLLNGTLSTGGIVGFVDAGVTLSITDSYSEGVLNGGSGISGGIIGSANAGTLSVTRVLVAGSITGTGTLGGIVGSGASVTSVSTYWDTQVTGRSSTADSGSSGESTAAMQTTSTYTGWDFVNIWHSPVLGQSYPTLRGTGFSLFLIFKVTANQSTQA
jgi:hypothetical protein